MREFFPGNHTINYKFLEGWEERKKSPLIAVCVCFFSLRAAVWVKWAASFVCGENAIETDERLMLSPKSNQGRPRIALWLRTDLIAATQTGRGQNWTCTDLQNSKVARAKLLSFCFNSIKRSSPPSFVARSHNAHLRLRRNPIKPFQAAVFEFLCSFRSTAKIFDGEFLRPPLSRNC